MIPLQARLQRAARSRAGRRMGDAQAAVTADECADARAAEVLEALVLVALVLLAAVAAGVRLPPNPVALVPLAAFVAGSAGYSLLMSGPTLLYKRLEMLVDLLAGVALVLSGTFFPLERLPAWLAAAGRLVFPAAQPTEAAREILLAGRSLGSLRFASGAVGSVGTTYAACFFTNNLQRWLLYCERTILT